jgi:parvulin-like peptidyl-prolyl isomerase
MAIVLGGALVLAVVIAALTGGLTNEKPSGDAVAVVDGDEISRADFDAALDQAIKSQQLPQAPEQGTPEYDQVRNQALGRLLQEKWLEKEAADRGVEVTDQEIEQELQSVRQQQQLSSDKAFQKALQQAGLTEDELRSQLRLQVISNKIQEDLTGQADKPTDDDIQKFYDANKSSFEQPESRDIRYILNADEAKAKAAKAALDQDNSAESWKKVAAQYSTDATTKNEGGVRAGVTQGSFEDALDSAIFDASEGEVSGPVQTSQGFYVFQVDSIKEAGVKSLSEVKDQISQQLTQQFQQEYVQGFINRYRDRWTEVTHCAEGFEFELCDNFVVKPTPCPDPSLAQPQQDQQLEQNGCPPPVMSASPAAPGSILPFTPATGQPQRPHPAGEDTAPATAPGGAFPGGIPGAGGAPPGGAPAGGAPPAGAAPQTGAPPQG